MPTPAHRPDGIDPSSAATVTELAMLLGRLRLRAGNPALREIERLGRNRGVVLPRTTIAEVLAGRRTPRLQVLLALVEVLGTPEDQLPLWAAAWEHIIERQQDREPHATEDDGSRQVVGYPVDAMARESYVWRFPDDHPVTLVCAQLPERVREPTPYTDPEDPDYSELLTYADRDALLYLYGHVRALNPHLEVRISTTASLRSADYLTHLVILGGTDFNVLTRDMLSVLRLPVRMPMRTEDQEWIGFEVIEEGDERRICPVLEEAYGRNVLREDVLLFFRGVNPFNSDCTITICAGIFARGTLAAVRLLTDPMLGQSNEAYLEERFSESSSFGFIARAMVTNGAVVPPDLSLAENRLYEWMSPT
jgi:hypothetical protein